MTSRSDTIPNMYQKKCLEMIDSLIEISASSFFLVDPGMNHQGVVTLNADPSIDKDYTTRFAMMDPLNPENFSESDIKVATLDSQISPHILKQTLYYQDFMVPHHHRYVADIFFRDESRIIAVLSLLREESLGNFTKEEVDMLKKLQPFMEYTLNKVYLPRKHQERKTIKEKYNFTDREIEVLEMLLKGLSNKQIALEINLGLATIKTHLHHIFQKAETDSRSELVAKILNDLNNK